jgi:hypothetical protein
MKAALRKYWKMWVAVCVLALLFLAYFAYRHRAHVSSAFGWISEETGGKTIAVLTIALTLCGLVYGLFCFIFPILVYSGLRDLRRRTAEIEQTIQMCAKTLTGEGSERKSNKD